MAKKSKAKISRVKRNNQTTNKMKKQGKLRLQRHRTKVQKQMLTSQPQVEYSSASDSESGEEWADMLDEGEKEYILSRINKQPQLLANVPEQEEKIKSKKRKKEVKEKMPREKKLKVDSDSGAESYSEAASEESESEVEEKYEQEMADKPVKRTRPLLPIKTKQGLMEREEEVVDSESEDDYKTKEDTKTDTTQSDSVSDSGTEETGAENEAPPEDPENKVVSAVELLAARRDKLQHEKLRIGALCSSLLEDPERKLKNLYPILYLMEERLKDGTLNLHSVRKLATISTCEVFKDILPDYHIRHQDYSNVKLKKDTLAMYKSEKELLEFYKRYLQRLEKATNALRPKKGDNRKLDEATASLGLVSLRSLCAMLVARPHFNYAVNVAQSVVPLLDCRLPGAREIVTEACVNVFAEDSKGDITLAIVRLINQLVKRRGERLNPSALDCLLSLKIRDVDLDEATDLRHKKKQDEKHKKRIVNLSKKEKKRAKKLKEVERELLETEAQENETARKKQLTEVTKTVFHIYFRLLKSAPGSKLLAAALDGLAKFTHVINLEFYSDLVAILRRLLAEDATNIRERLLVVRCVLAILSGSGDALNVDPAAFHQQLYVDMLQCHAGHTAELFPLVLQAVQQLCARARRVSAAVLLAFTKRLLAAAAHAPPHAALAAIAIAARTSQQNKCLSSLFEADAEAGSGRYDPLLASPEHCRAQAAAARELCALAKHYHPAVRQAAAALARGELLPAFGKLSPIDIYESYDGSQMSFKPSIPPPKHHEKPSRMKSTHFWSQASLQQLCELVESNVDLTFKGAIVR